MNEAFWARARREAAMLWAFWSVRVSAALSLLAAWLVAEPTALPTLVAYVPEAWRPAAGVAAGFVMFAVHAVARRMPQRGVEGGGDA